MWNSTKGLLRSNRAPGIFALNLVLTFLFPTDFLTELLIIAVYVWPKTEVCLNGQCTTLYNAWDGIPSRPRTLLP